MYKVTTTTLCLLLITISSIAQTGGSSPAKASNSSTRTTTSSTTPSKTSEAKTGAPVNTAPIATLTPDKETSYLELVGAFSAAFVYNAFSILGAIADGNVEKTYSNEKVEKLYKEQFGFYSILDEKLKKLLSDSAVTAQGDKEFVADVRTILQNLKKQGEYFLYAIQDGSKAAVEGYRLQRKETWRLISELLGLDE